MKKYILVAFIALLFGACNENDFLKETPLDFMSANNSYTTKADFDASVTDLYYLVRFEFYNNQDASIDFIRGTDILYGSSDKSNLTAEINPTAGGPKTHWDKLYLLIAQSNVIISRLPESEVPTDEQTLYEAKAKFFRGFAYRTLAYLYGGVPLQLDEVKAPKTDYVRSTREETLAQAISDVKFAAENLQDFKDVKDGEITSAAAYHLLAELYLATGKNQEAVDAATKVIDNPALELMQNRFGTRATEKGNVCWDLFRRGNQNRSSGNTEGIFVVQFETDVLGGGSWTSKYFWDNPGNYLLERNVSPQTGLFRINYNGLSLAPFNWPVGDYTGGRGIGSFIPTDLYYTQVWEGDFDNDLRNSNENFVRKFAFNNPGFVEEYGDIFGDSIDVMNPTLPDGASIFAGYFDSESMPNRFLMGYSTKCTTPFNHPAELYADAENYILKSSAGGTYPDQYMFRLAETYLLRAEAYLNLNETGKAAADINKVRSRAQASPVEAADVTLDYILDERVRELGIEEKRRLTLGRLGEDVFYNRVTTYNSWYSDPDLTADGLGFQRKFTLYPIPQSAIESNKDAVLEQNPGY